MFVPGLILSSSGFAGSLSGPNSSNYCSLPNNCSLWSTKEPWVDRYFSLWLLLTHINYGLWHSHAFCFCWWLGLVSVPFNILVVFNLVLRNTTFSVHQIGMKHRNYNPKSWLLGSSSWACYCAFYFVVKMIKIRDYSNSPCISSEATKNSPGKKSTFKSFSKK